MKKIILALTMVFSLIATNLFADPFSKYLSKDERAKLEKGEVVIKKLSNYKKLSVASNDYTKPTIDIIKKLDPSFISEVIQILPYKGNEDIISKVETALNDFDSYAGIPYFSERQQKWYKLYASAKATEITKNDNKTKILADLEMSVFGVVKTEINTEKTDTSYFYTTKNLNILRYHDKFDAVGKQKFKSAIVIYKDGENWILYGVGGVDVPRLPFISDRIETSFLNRTKSFCKHIFEQLDKNAKTETKEVTE